MKVMSNHDGGFMLNCALSVADEMGILKIIGREKSKQFAIELTKLGERHDCNSGEILEGIGAKMCICCCCLKDAEDLDWGLCKVCRE